ncbi:MAG TPA: tRNA (adenosine(37)-N6)-dimethylallyltransferase MiaA [Chitinispirillaceae bacterium]|nr:tRNA (adenosine(37)-N6)-dimethylallyltransferase MiaA [Chitinispirillaceae bacterium]
MKTEKEMEIKDLIVICGPTASGKTRLGVYLASQYNGEIISADSRQVYRGMDIGTGKDLNEYFINERKIPCHLIDIADPQSVYTLFDYQRDFYQVYREIKSRGRVPFLVGGSGLYIEAVLKNYQIPAIPENEELRENLNGLEKEELRRELEKIDPELYSRTDLSSKKRIIRALEIACYRRENPQKDETGPVEKINPLVICTRWDREQLRKRIDLRLELRLQEGMIDEVRRILESGISRKRYSLFGMEYGHLARYIEGEVSYTQAVEQLRHSIHQLAKRQETWFRGMQRRGIEVHWINGADQKEASEIVGRYFSPVDDPIS